MQDFRVVLSYVNLFKGKYHTWNLTIVTSTGLVRLGLMGLSYGMAFNILNFI
jgi:hypothetical protein